jgi:acyl-CoA thioesterase
MLGGFHVWALLGTYVYLDMCYIQIVVAIKSTIFRDVTLCSIVHRHFGGVLVNLYQTTQHHIPENGTIHSIAAITSNPAV